jgi:large subunit ribosomal protein L10
MNREQKATAIAEIATQIGESNAIFAVDYRGISVSQAAELRSNLREADALFKVVKNSLTERAAEQAGVEALKAYLTGPTALTFVRGDVAVAAKALADYGRAVQLLPVKGGLMEGAVLEVEQIRTLSRLPSREALYGQLAGVVASPVSGLVRTLGALIGGLAVALAQVREKKAEEEPAAEAEAAGDAETQPAAEQTEARAVEAAEEAEAAGDAETQPAAEQTEARAVEAEADREAKAAAAPASENQAEPEAQAPAQEDDNQADAATEVQSEDAEAKSTKED